MAFRCDAGYKIPTPAWQYIIARVQDEFSETIFLLEGLGGAWEITQNLLTTGGMQWAYSELFQNYSGKEVAWYLDYANRQNGRVGSYVNYSETHDNDRLAKKGRVWSLLRNRLCALTSPCGSFGFTCGVEWLATEKIRVHGNTGLNWDATSNIVAELAQLNDAHLGSSMLFRRRQAHAFERARFHGSMRCAANRRMARTPCWSWPTRMWKRKVPLPWTFPLSKLDLLGSRCRSFPGSKQTRAHPGPRRGFLPGRLG